MEMKDKMVMKGRRVYKEKLSKIEIKIERDKMADYKKLANVIDKVKDRGCVNEVPSNILEVAIAEEFGVSPATMYGYKRLLLNLRFIYDTGKKNKNIKIYGINKVSLLEK